MFIEHLGGHAGAAKAMVDMGRVLKPGVVATVVTEMIVNGKPHDNSLLPRSCSSKWWHAPIAGPGVQAAPLRLGKSRAHTPEKRLHAPL